MIDAREKCDLVTDKLEALLNLQELRTRLKFLEDYIHEQERKAGEEALEYPHGYNTNIEKVEIKASKVLWFLGLAHDEKALKMFEDAEKAFLAQKVVQNVAEKGEQDGEAVREGQS